ncbi:MAG: hypothetical protein FJ405_16285, partial [Verrucomicrobia bacterium]|nr:hypothetical protein [Verrucomicrobiota bacterium]
MRTFFNLTGSPTRACNLFISSLFLLIAQGSSLGAVKDSAFLQESSQKTRISPELDGADFKKLVIDRDGVVFVLTSKGVARLFENILALDKSHRPLAGLVASDITLHDGNVYYLFDDKFLSNELAGAPLTPLPKDTYRSLSIADGNMALLAGPEKVLRTFQKRIQPVEGIPAGFLPQFVPFRNEFFVASGAAVYRVFGTKAKLFHSVQAPVTAMALRGVELIVATTNGFVGISVNDASTITPQQKRLPCPHITSVDVDATGDLWMGSVQGVFRITKGGQIAYYASQRWLPDDFVRDVRRSPDGDTYVLTQSGLARIQFQSMTLDQKAAHYDRKIRQRHNRYGFSAELRLSIPGDPSTAEMIDTDNDGTWSNYYMASQAFRFGSTSDPEARTNAWRTFAAMERLEQIAQLKGFPARSFERTGFKVSDVDRWRPSKDPEWEWKGHTSSDEITAHTFGCAVMWEVAARSPGEKERVARFFDKLMTHIVKNNWYLMDVDGKPTLWGRWHPDYVNSYPETIVDRRLNSASIIAGLQLAHKITGKSLYKDKAYELMDKYGYLTNILSSMTLIAPTTGHVHMGHDMGDEWNHSDDLLSFVTYWVLHRFAFNEDLRAKYAAAIKDHWELERWERNPLWNFIYASTGARDYDLDGAVWTL